MPKTQPTSEAVEDYAKAIYSLQQRAAAARSAPPPWRSGWASPSSVTAMVKRLDEMRLVRYGRLHGVLLTDAGERIALEVLRHHRLLESYLAEAFDMPWDRVHDEAEVLEHYISEELEELIAAKLGDPKRDPHGDPIPSRDLALADEVSMPLSEVEAGETVVFVRVSDSDASMLRYLADLGVYPGANLVVGEQQPFGGPKLIVVEGHTHGLGPALADRIRVRPAPRRRRS